VQPSKVGQYDLAIPQLTNLLRRSEAAVDQIDVTTFGVRLTATADADLPSATQLATRTDMLTKRVEEKLELDLPLPSGPTGIIWFYTRGALKKVKMPTTLFERLAGPMKRFLTQIAFGGPVDLDEPRIWWRLLQDDAYESVTQAFARAINAATRTEATVELRAEQARLVSQTAAFVWGKQVCAGAKTVFNLVPVDSGLEADLVAYLDAAPDVAAYAKNTNKVGLTIDYQSQKGHFRLYQPDFVVRLTDDSYWLVETKGLEDLEVARKDARARQWCADASELTASTERPQRWQYVKVLEETFRARHSKRFDELAAHARAATQQPDDA
jgi:type III restriction enzyme